MGLDYQWANVEEQQGDFLEWVGRKEDGEGGIRSLELQLNGTVKGPALKE